MDEQMTCIICPRGCELKVVNADDISKIEVYNNLCARGKNYVIKEKTNPERTITATVKIINGVDHRLPVRTDGEVPKVKYMEIMDIINNYKVEAPIRLGQILIEDIFGTGRNLIATKSIDKK